MMDSPQPNINGHSSLNCSRLIKVEQFSVTKQNSRLSDEVLSPCGDGTSKESEKSFVQQRIERLYGPTALGMGFQAKRALLERYKEGEKDQNERKEIFKDSPQGLPSVFRHLRPEFRHQLPVKPKASFNLKTRTSFTPIKQESVASDGVVNGHRVRHIPIEMEEDNSTVEESANGSLEKSWETLRQDLQAVNDKSNIKKDVEANKVIVPDLKTVDLNENTNGSLSKKKEQSDVEATVKDGNYFLNVVATEVSNLEPKIVRIEKDLEAYGDHMTEEVKGKLWAASGKAKLLIRQKIEQFRGLCFKNISKSNTEEFPTTNEDLAGFWDMVSIQVDDVNDILQEVDLIRNNDWKEVSKIGAPESTRKPMNRKLKGGTSGTPAQNTARNIEAKHKAEERRKQMKEVLIAKRKKACQSKNSNKDTDEIEIFIPTK